MREDNPTPRDSIDTLFLLCVNNLGGAELSIFRIIRGLKKKGMRVGLAVYGAQPELVPDDLGVPVIRLEALRTVQAAVPFYRALRRYAPRVIVSSLTDTNVMALFISLVSGRHAKVIAVEHSLMARVKALCGYLHYSLLQGLMLFLYPRAGAIVAVSKSLAVDLRERLPSPCRVETLYNPVLSTIPAPQSPSPHSWLEDGQPPVVRGVGRLSEEKNFSLLIQAFAEAAQKRLGWPP